MRKMKLLGTTVLQSAAFTSAVMLAQPALAQDAAATDQDAATAAQPAPEAPPAQSTDCAANPNAPNCAIVVTGSRIKQPNLESTVPVTSISGQEFFETGQTSIGDTLNELPALRSTFSQANSTRFLGTGGLNLLDLRGLGTQRTLVLVNGRRHIASDILGNAVEVDINTIPTDLVERVDVVTGGNSAIYGSDAIAGVVNFVLKQDYEGLQVRGQGGISKYGDAGNYYISALGGMNFADGRGNVALNFEYARQDDWYASQRGECFSTSCGFVQVEDDNDNEPDRKFFKDIRSTIYTNGGAMYFCCEVLPPSSNVGGGLYTVPYKFLPNGDLVPITGEKVGLSYFGSFIGGNGDNFRDGKQFGFSPALDRYAFNLIGHYEVSPAIVPFIEAKWVRTDSLSNSAGPFFTSAIGERWGAAGPHPGRNRELLFSDNPYLSPQARAVMGDPAGNGSYSFLLYRNYIELGNREEKARRDTFRIVGGLRGDFNDDWSYEVSLNYGKLKERTDISGNVNTQRYLLALDAVDEGLATGGPANGHIVCRSQIDPGAAQALRNNLDPAFAASQLAADVAACVPINPFGNGNTSQAAKDYILRDGLAKGWIKEFVANAFMSGDTGDWINLPGGPIGFAIGAEHRNYDVSYKQDDFTVAGMTFYNAIPDFTPPTFKVNEVFGELRLPILKDQFIDELTISGAARYAKYKTFGGVWAYNLGGELAPIKDIRFRANYSRAVRAPSLADAYTPLGTNFTPAPTDPCDINSINDTPNRAANCAADGVPVGYTFQYLSSLRYQSGGNPDLKPEKSDSWTVGGVVQPRFIPGLAISVDYYNITVNDVITSPSAQSVINSCYDLPTIDNQFCATFERNPGPGNGPSGEIPGRILEGSLHLIPFNYAKLKVRGIDTEVTYRTTIGSIGRLDTRLIWTHALQNDSFLDLSAPDFADQTLGELGDPKDAFNWNVSLKHSNLTFGYQMRYIGKMTIGPWEATHSKNGLDPQDPDYASKEWYPAVFYHDIRTSVDVTPQFNFYVGVDDVTNKKPPFGLSGAGGGSGIYRNIGRFFYAGAIAKF
ncbi:MAG TPA: TonB-dependent receptor [Sphingomicrobium sp.]|jgi:outer membrane receptor protein involved in Fe transport|nr:TonB-dependent receptor [Sphingomicrobium sp.]